MKKQLNFENELAEFKRKFNKCISKRGFAPIKKNSIKLEISF